MTVKEADGDKMPPQVCGAMLHGRLLPLTNSHFP